MRFLAPLVQLTSLVAVIAFAGAQNATRSKLAVRSKPQLQNCPATLSMTYIDTVKEITESTLNDFGTSMPILEPLTMPLAFGLTSALPQADQKTSVKALSPTVIRNGLGMKLLANAITSMVDQWASVKARLEAIQKTASEIITTINEITTATMTNLGAQYPELKPITEPLVMALSFSSNNGRGNSVFNWDLEPATVGLNLRLFSGNVTQMADKWEATTNHYLAQEKECRGNDINETADSRADVTTPSSMLNCVASLTTRRQYITTVNQITQSTLSSFARARPVFVTLTTPLTTGLAVNSFVAMAENASIAKIGDPITTTGMGMRLLSKALTTMVNKWEDAQFKFREIENADCVWEWITGKNNCAASIANRRIFIDSINEITRSTLTDLGQQHPRLQRITNPLRVTISFNPISMTGSGLFNFNLPITKTGEHLKAFAQTLDDMVKQWEQTKMKFLQQEQNECRSTNRVETTTTTTPPSTTTVKQSSSSSPLTTTSPTITRITTTTAAALTPDAVTVKTPTNCSQSVATRQNTITTLNGYTRKKMTDFGTQVPRLRPLITSLWIGLNFNPFTQKGAALFNYNEDVSTVAANLQLLAKEIDKMAAEWQQMVRVTCPEPPVTTRGNVTARTGALPAVQNVTEPALPRPATVKG